jgi:hypothetical protein
VKTKPTTEYFKKIQSSVPSELATKKGSQVNLLLIFTYSMSGWTVQASYFGCPWPVNCHWLDEERRKHR